MERRTLETEAARLVVECAGSGDPDARANAIGWATASVDKAVAFARAERTWDLAERLHALPMAGDAPADETTNRRALFGGLIAATIVAAAAALVVERSNAVDLYRTGTGESRSFVLADGSRLTLNTDSAAEVALHGASRSVHLLRGEAMFDVVHDRRRPFLVRAGESSLRVLGTAFNVRIRDRLVELTVTRGAVGVGDATTGVRRVTAGGTAAISGGAVAVAAPDAGAIARRTAWQAGRIALDGQTLEQAVAEFNRYSSRPIVLGDADLAALRMGGTFGTGDAAAFIEALQATFPIRAVSGRDHSILLVSADGS